MIEEKARILVVDDDLTVCDFLKNALGEFGYGCTVVASGEEALNKLNNSSFDIVLLDIRLPGMSGMIVLQEIWLSRKGTRVIMITGMNDVDVVVSAMKLGALDYIVKPFDLDKLASSIKSALEIKQTINKPHTEMDAIAHGVEIKTDPFSLYEKSVTQKTIEIARKLQIDEKEIQNWVVEKIKLNRQKKVLISLEEESAN